MKTDPRNPRCVRRAIVSEYSGRAGETLREALQSIVSPVSFALLLFWAAQAHAALIVPSSYTSTPGEGMAQGGFLNYFDDTGTQLTDGVYGANDWSADLGNGPAYEWVAWRFADPVVVFQFASPVTLDQIGIDFNRNESVAQIFLPSTVTIDGTPFSVPSNAIPDSTRGTVFFNGTWSGSTLTIAMADNDPNRWIFVDEITFDAVPEPGVLALLAGAAAALRLRSKAGNSHSRTAGGY